MIDTLARSIKLGMQSKTDDELLAIWTENNQSQWSAGTFRAIEAILRERGIAIPQQKPYVPEPESHPPDPLETRRHRRFRWAFIITALVDGWANSTRISNAVRGRNFAYLFGAAVGLFIICLLVGSIAAWTVRK